MGEKYLLMKVREGSRIRYFLEKRGVGGVEDVNRFLECVFLKGSSERTVVSYGYDLLDFYTWLDEFNMEIEKLTEYDLYQYIGYQKERGSAPKSINRRLATVTQYWRFCFGNDLPGGKYLMRPTSFYKGQNMGPNMGIQPQRRVKKLLRVKVPYKLQVPLSSDDVKIFLKGIKKYRDLSMVYLMLHCGLRSHEVLSLKNQNISILRRQILVRGKGDKERILFLPSYVLQMLERYKDFERPKTSHDYFFVVLKGKNKAAPMTRAGLREIFRYRRKVSGVTSANPHRWRHTFAVDMIRSGVSVATVQRLMGHEDINMTMNYVNLSPMDIREEYLRVCEGMKKKYE